MSRPRCVFWLFVRQELILSVRARSLQIFAVVFAALALLVASSGYVLTGGTGLQDFARTAASLVELVLLVVPLASLVLGVTALTPDTGSAELLYSQPIARSRILFARLTGLYLALVAAEAIGFGTSGLVLFSRTGHEGLAAFFGVIGASAVLTAVFLGLAASVTAGGGSRQRARSLATALVVWFAAVVLFDVAILAVVSWMPSGLGSRLLIGSAIANPVDAVRTATLMSIEGTAAFGDASLAFLRFTGDVRGAALWLGASLLFWMVVPITLASARLNRSDI